VIFRLILKLFGFDGRPRVKRSAQWPALQRRWLKDHPCCEACGAREGLEVHHIRPVHLYPELELDAANLMTLCKRHHLVFGHLELYSAWNPKARTDVAIHRIKVANRRLERGT
jgi:5-methylcytosine-specific restriction protein A